MKLSPLAGIFLSSGTTVMLIVVIASAKVSFWTLVGLAYILPLSLICLAASIKQLRVHSRR